MEKILAKAISVVFHPLLLPTYALLLLFSTNFYFVLVLPEAYKYLILGFVFITTFVLPSLMMLILLKAKMISSLQMENSKERVLPMFIVAAFFFVTFYFLRESPQAAIFNLFMLGATILVLLSVLINYITKISIHMVAQGGLFGTFTGMALVFHQDILHIIYLIIIVAGLTGFARLKLKAHSSMQVYLGFLLGSIFMLAMFLFV
jgi:hypothetical protein